jgi:phosphotriesterase-related protein
MKSVMSVIGRIPANKLGLTLPHEHLFTDLSFYLNSVEYGKNLEYFSQKITSNIRFEVSQKPWSFKDNIVLRNYEDAITEANGFKSVGGNTIVDVSPCAAMGRNPQGLLSVSLNTGLNIIMACGRYSEPSMTDSEKHLEISDLVKRLLDEFTNGFEDSGIKPGILKVGFVDALDKEPEIRTLRAAGKVQNLIGCALYVHPHIWKSDSHVILDILEEEGCDLRKVILCHQDYLGHERDYLSSLIKRGPFIEFDTFGSGWINDPMWKKEESQKIDHLINQINDGNASHLLISGDMCMKIMLECGGGMGLKNIPVNTIPALLARGIDQEIVNQIVIENPMFALCH